MKFIIPKCATILIIGIIISCSPPLGINELPMYGNMPKSAELVNADNAFVNRCRRQFPSLDSASNYMTDKGWYYLNRGDVSTAMKRFNQAWLLDSTNEESYWGMAIIVSSRDRDYRTAAKLMDNAPFAVHSVATLATKKQPDLFESV